MASPLAIPFHRTRCSCRKRRLEEWVKKGTEKCDGLESTRPKKRRCFSTDVVVCPTMRWCDLPGTAALIPSLVTKKALSSSFLSFVENNSFRINADGLSTNEIGLPQFAMRTANHFHQESSEQLFLHGNSTSVASARRTGFALHGFDSPIASCRIFVGRAFLRSIRGLASRQSNS
jgi:hypothetical protein